MTESNRYGDTPLGKSDEQLREEGADALTNTERRSGHAEGGDVAIAVSIPVGGVGTPGGAVAGVGGVIAPALVVGDADKGEVTREDI